MQYKRCSPQQVAMVRQSVVSGSQIQKGSRSIRSDTDRLWERTIGDGFADLRKAGLANPMTGDIEKELGISR